MKPKSPGPYILVFLLLVLLFLSFFVPAGLILSMDNFLPFKYERYQYQIGISSLILSLVFLTAAVKFLLWGMRNMATNLDILFGNLGLSAEHHVKDGRHYFGNLDGRRVDIFCKPVKHRRYFGDVKTVKYIGHALEIYGEGNFNTRSSIGIVREGEGVQGKINTLMATYFSEKFIDKFGGQILRMDDPMYQDLAIYALDQVWTQGFLNNEEIRSALLELLGKDIQCVSQHVHITPKAVHFKTLTSIRSLKKEHIRLMVDKVLKIAAAGESLPRASATSEETEAERMRRLGKR